MACRWRVNGYKSNLAGGYDSMRRKMKIIHIISGGLMALAIAGGDGRAHGQVSNPSVRDSATDPAGVACTSAAPILVSVPP
jgi:hypothetical protein